MDENKVYGPNDVNKHGQLFLFRGESADNGRVSIVAPITGWYEFSTLTCIEAQPELDGFLND